MQTGDSTIGDMKYLPKGELRTSIVREKRSLSKTDAKDALYRRREPWILQKIAGITEGKLLLLRVNRLVSRKQIVTPCDSGVLLE